MINIGERLTIHYPKRNHIRNDWPLVPRDVKILRLRDLVRQPLTIDEFLRRPYLHRSRYLATAFDLQRQAYRQFYLGASQEFSAPGSLFAGVYRDGKLDRLLGREFQSSVTDRRLMLRILPHWQADLGEGESIGIIAADFQVIA